jgi:methionine synthase / methylenetetrahydrofolate reductase(NADPH)
MAHAMPDNVILVGFMGAGKSAVGRLLARRLGRCFVETDDVITAREGRSIPEIFAEHGEGHFRVAEAAALVLLAQKRGDVIATGGGLPCREGRPAALRALGTVVWLAGDFETLYGRARREGHRPMLAGRSRDEVEALYRTREPFYRQADITVDTTDLTPDQVVGAVVRALHGLAEVQAAFLARLARQPLLCDGAMGTMLYARGVPLDACFDVLNLRDPALVQGIHAEYLQAGADCIQTNTFGASRFKLAVHGLGASVREINLRGAKLARDVRESMGRDVFVLGSVGPLGKYLAPLGAMDRGEARAAFREQAEGLLEGGVDGFVVETFSDLQEAALAVEAIRAVSDLPIVVEAAFTEEGVTFLGRRPADVVRTLRALPVQVVGANCSVGSSVLYDVLERMLPEAGGLPVAIQPNAGLPSRVGERLMYLSSPGYMAEYAVRMVGAGARLVGGCCGTTPQHIRAMREALDRREPGRGPARIEPPRRPRAEVREPPRLAPRLGPTTLQRRLQAREFVITVELDPPRGHNIEKLVQGAELLKERGVEILDINDGSLGRVRMAVLPTAILVREATGLDINMHFTCRDRNLMGIQGDLLGAHAMDIRNILAMTGDPPRTGDYVNATAVFDVDAIGLLRILAGMNDGRDATGNSIGEPTSFCVGVALNPAAEDPAHEMERFLAKAEGGAQWAQTQPVYDLEVLERFFGATRPPIPVIVGLLPLHSARHAEFLHNEVPGISIPDAVRARMREAGERGRQAGIEMTQALLQAVRGRYAGAYLMPSFGRFEVVAEVLEALH